MCINKHISEHVLLLPYVELNVRNGTHCLVCLEFMDFYLAFGTHCLSVSTCISFSATRIISQHRIRIEKIIAYILQLLPTTITVMSWLHIYLWTYPCGRIHMKSLSNRKKKT